MKQRLWMVAMSVIVLTLGFGGTAHATNPPSRCVAYACFTAADCDLGCSCQFAEGATNGTCAL